MRPETVKRPGHDQLFQHPAIKLFNIGTGAQVEKLAEITALITGLDDRFDRAFTHAFNRADTVNNLSVIVNVEMVLTGVDIRRQDLQSHSPALIHQAHHLLGVIHIGGHYRGHKLCRVVRFEPQGLIGDQRVGSGVRFVKPVSGKFLYQIEDFHRQFAVDAVLFRPILKDRTLLGHLFWLFLTHSTTQHVRAAEGIAREYLGNLHNLFLIQDNAVGWLQHRFQAFVLPLHIRIGKLFAAVLTVDKVIYHPRLQRPRTEKCHQGDHVFEAVRLQAFDQIFHAAGFKLEYRRGFRTLQHVEAFLVIQRDRGDIDRLQALFGPARVDHLQRPVDDGERTQAEEVKLHQASVFYVVLIKLGDRVRTGFIAVEWRKIGNFGRSNNHPTGVFTGVTGDALQLTRHIDQRFDLFVGLVDFWQLRLCFEGFRQGHARIGRYQLRDTVNKAVRMPQYAAHVADNRFCGHGTEGNNL